MTLNLQRQLEQAQVALDKTVVYAGVDGQVAQFFLQRGDYVNPILRPAGVLIPSDGPESGRYQIAAGFNQLSAQVIKAGTITEVVCMSKPFTVIPMIVTRVQPVVAAGQLKPADILLDAQQRARQKLERFLAAGRFTPPPARVRIARDEISFGDEDPAPLVLDFASQFVGFECRRRDRRGCVAVVPGLPADRLVPAEIALPLRCAPCETCSKQGVRPQARIAQPVKISRHHYAGGRVQSVGRALGHCQPSPAPNYGRCDPPPLHLSQRRCSRAGSAMTWHEPRGQHARRDAR